MNKNQEYWKKRAEEVAAIQFNKVDDYIFRINHEYQEALNSINKDIEVFYKRFAQNNGISLSEARRSLNSNQLNEFKMDLAEFTRKAKSNTNQLWENELNNVSCKVRITRLQALQIQINNKIQELYSKHQVKGIDILKDIYKDTYYRNMYEIQRGIGIASSFARIDNNALDKVINEKWREGNYSSRVWANKGKLLLELQTNLSQSFIRGDSVDKTAKVIGSRLNVDRNRARALVNTEGAYITQKATFDSYSASRVIKQYEILATLDLKTSEICRSLDGEVFNLSERNIGVNAPPFHTNCRTTTIAHFDDAIDEERIARDSDGKQYYVDGNMSYKDWYSKNVKGNPQETLNEKIMKNKSSDKQQYEKFKEILGNQVPKSFDKFQELKYNDINKWEQKKRQYKAWNQIDSDESKLSDYKSNMKETYNYFKDNGHEFTTHGINRFLGQRKSKGKRVVSKEETLDLLSRPMNYIQPDGSFVRHYDNIAIVSASDTNEIVSIISRQNPKADWKER